MLIVNQLIPCDYSDTNVLMEMSSDSSGESQDLGEVNTGLEMAYLPNVSRPQWVKGCGSWNTDDGSAGEIHRNTRIIGCQRWHQFSTWLYARWCGINNWIFMYLLKVIRVNILNMLVCMPLHDYYKFFLPCCYSPVCRIFYVKLLCYYQ